MTIQIEETKYKRFVVAKSLEDAMIPWFYKEAPPSFDTYEDALNNKTKNTTIFEFDCTKHDVTHKESIS